MNIRIPPLLVTAAAFYASIASAPAQGGFQSLPNHNLFPQGSSLNPIYVQPVNPPPVVYPPPVIYPAPQINIQPRERVYVPERQHVPERVSPRQEKLAPRPEFERIRFIPVEPYVYRLAKGDMHDQIPKGKTRIVIGKTKVLNSDVDSASEVAALRDKYHADEVIARPGRQWDDAGELLIKFIVWKDTNSESVSPESAEPNPTSEAISSPPSITYRVVNVRENDYLSLRQGPGSDYKLVNKLPSEIGGIELKERRVANGETIWQEISVSGQSGFVNADYLAAERSQDQPMPGDTILSRTRH